jgi:methyl-accepting chemotaxis protein
LSQIVCEVLQMVSAVPQMVSEVLQMVSEVLQMVCEVLQMVSEVPQMVSEVPRMVSEVSQMVSKVPQMVSKAEVPAKTYASSANVVRRMEMVNPAKTLGVAGMYSSLGMPSSTAMAMVKSTVKPLS